MPELDMLTVAEGNLEVTIEGIGSTQVDANERESMRLCDYAFAAETGKLMLKAIQQGKTPGLVNASDVTTRYELVSFSSAEKQLIVKLLSAGKG